MLTWFEDKPRDSTACAAPPTCAHDWVPRSAQQSLPRKKKTLASFKKTSTSHRALTLVRFPVSVITSGHSTLEASAMSHVIDRYIGVTFITFIQPILVITHVQDKPLAAHLHQTDRQLSQTLNTTYAESSLHDLLVSPLLSKVLYQFPVQYPVSFSCSICCSTNSDCAWEPPRSQGRGNMLRETRTCLCHL